MKNSKDDRIISLLGALSSAMAVDVLAMSDDELREELGREKIDPAFTAAELRRGALQQIAEFRRKRLQEARAGLASRMDRPKAPPPDSATVLQRISTMKALFAAKADLSLAFREGRTQSTSDWMSVWDNLLELGLVREDDGD